MSKSSRIYKIFMTTMIVAIAGMLLAMGIIAAQKTMKLGVRFPSNPNYRLEIWIQKTGEDAQPVFCNFEDEGLNKQVEMQNGITSLDGNTISADNSFFTKYGNDFTLIIKNYTESTGIEVSMTSTATMLQGGNGIPAQIEAEKTAASKFENEQSLDSVSFRVYVNSVFPQTTSLKIIISELNSYSVTVDSTTNNFNFDGATKNEIGADYTAILKAHTGYNLSITVKQGGVTLTAGQDYTWDSETGQLRIPSVTGNIEITCVAILAQGTITFNWNNDVDGLAVTYKSTTPPSEMTYTSGETKVLKDSDITKVGCEFLGWTYPGQTEPQKNLDLGTLSGDLEITANWGATLVKGGDYNLSSFGYLVYGNFVSEVNLAVERPTLGDTKASLIKSITFGYWEDYKDFVLVDTYSNTENTIAYGIPIDVNGEGSIRLFGNGTKAYILSPNKIFANENLDKLFDSSVVVNGSNGNRLTYTHEINELIFDNFDTSKVTSMNSMFSGCSGLTSLDLSSFNTSNVTNMQYMFQGCSGLTSLDLSSFNTSKVVWMNQVFHNCSGLTSLNLSSFDTSKVTDMSYMFDSCIKLTSLDLSSFNTSNVTNMSYMFEYCSGLTSLDLSSFNTVNVTNMNNMFDSCIKLTSLNLSSFNTSNVTNMSYMFEYCSGLTSLDLSSFNTSNVTNMEDMFYNCGGLTSLDVSNFNTSNVTNMGYMFRGCSSLTSLNVSNFDTSKVTDMWGMFARCSGLTIFDLRSFNTSNVTNMTEMFYGCSGLTKISVTSGRWSTANVTSSDNMFAGCTSLPNFDSSVVDKTNAVNSGVGGYLTIVPNPYDM